MAGSGRQRCRRDVEVNELLAVLTVTFMIERKGSRHMSWLKPRSIRGQLISGLILFEGLLVVGSLRSLVREQASEIHERARLRLESEVNLLAVAEPESLARGQAGYLVQILRA